MITSSATSRTPCGVAEPRDRLPVAVLGRDHAARADHRLADEGGDLPAAGLEEALQLVDVVRRDLDRVADDGAPVPLAHQGDPGEARPERVHAVIGVLAADDDPLLRVPQRVPVAAGQLGGGVDGVGAARAEEDRGALHRGQGRQPVGQLEGRRRREGAEVRVGGQGRELASRGVGDLRPAVADVAVPEARGGVEVAAPVGVLDPRPGTPDQDQLVVLDLAHVGEGVPVAGRHRDGGLLRGRGLVGVGGRGQEPAGPRRRAGR